MKINSVPSNSIAMIYCYFGRWPWYFKFFLKSCSYNPDIDFIFITDIKKPEEYPDNVTFVKYSLLQIEQLATKKLGFKANISYPYKLCDFKPAYGFLFDTLLKGYDFWGFGDIDIILGKVRNFITPEILQNYDIISGQDKYPSGYFMLFKNTGTINTLFKRSADYKKVFTSSIHYCFDECNFKFASLENGKSIFETNAKIDAGSILETTVEIESLMHIIKSAEQEKIITPYFDFLIVEGNPGRLKWEKGILSYKNELEVLLYHMIDIKADIYFKFPNWKQVPETYYIDETSFLKNSKKIWKGAFMSFFDKKIRVRFIKMKFRSLLIINQLYNFILKSKNFENKKCWIGFYWDQHFAFKVSYEQSQFILTSGNGINNAKKELLLPLFNSKTTFTSKGEHMTIKFKSEEKEKKMITTSNTGKIRKYITR